MISSFFHSFIYTPLYNGLVFLIDFVPGHNVGVAVILLTVAVRVVLYPLARQAVKTQMAMREIAPKIEELKKKHKDSQEELARATFALYKEHNIRPFSSFLMLLIQIPLLIGLYWVFWKGGLPQVDASLLYSFVPNPVQVSMNFLGFFDMASRSIFLAALAGGTQLIYARLSMGERKPAPTGERSFTADLTHSMDLQMRYILPIMLGGFAYIASAAVALYFVTSNLFMILQEYLAGRRF